MWGRPPGDESGNPVQYSCLENPMEGGAWRAAVHRVAKTHTHMHVCICVCVCVCMRLLTIYINMNIKSCFQRTGFVGSS